MFTTFAKGLVVAAVVIAPVSASVAATANLEGRRMNSVQFDPTKGDAWSEEQMREAMPMTQTLPGLAMPGKLPARP